MTTMVWMGGPALSRFRLERLQGLLGAYLPGVTVSICWLFFASLARPLTNEEQARLKDLLDGAELVDQVAPEWVVLPRLGTISPWSSKAMDIVRRCGLEAVLRLERGCWIHYQSQTIPGDQESAAIRDLLHDRMIHALLPAELVNELVRNDQLFPVHLAPPLELVPVLAEGIAALEQANSQLGLALSPDEIDFFSDHFHFLGRDPTDVELMMFAQANSEHCRHKIFNASWWIDDQKQPKTLFEMIRHTHRLAPNGCVLAYEDNAAVIVGGPGERFHPDATDRVYRPHPGTVHLLIKVETHNHPTAIAPFPGAATGSGGEIRDEGATGRGGWPLAGVTGFAVSNLRLPGAVRPWEEPDYGKPNRIVSALAIMREGPIGAAAFNNEFGRPNLAGFFRTFEMDLAGERRGYHKPIMIAGGLGLISAEDVWKKPIPAGALILQLGGPAMLIGLGGGAASSQTSGNAAQSLDFASVQRDNPEMERRCQEVINACWGQGEANPILSIHDVGAGGLANAIPELLHGGGVGGWLDLASVPNDDPAMSPMEIWCNEAQERYVLAIEAKDLGRFTAMCARERCPVAVLGTATEQSRLLLRDSRLGAITPIDLDLFFLLGKPPRLERRVSRQVRAFTPLVPLWQSVDEAALRVLQLPTVAGKGFLITIGDRSVTGLVCRDQMVGPWQVPVADVAVTARGFTSRIGQAMAMGERTPVALLNGPASARLAIGEALTNLAAVAIDDLAQVKLSANWMAPAGHPGEDAELYATVAAVGLELCPRLGISIPVGKDSLSMRTVWQEGATPKAVTAPLSLIITAFAPVPDVVGHTLTPQLRLDAGETLLILVDLGQGKNRLGGSALAQVYGQLGDCPPDLDDPELLVQFFRVIRDLNREGVILAYHDRSDGGLWTTVCEMAFAGHAGFRLHLDEPGQDPMGELFAEELGAVLQIRKRDWPGIQSRLAGCGRVVALGRVTNDQRLVVAAGCAILLDHPREQLQQLWSETSWRLQALRDNPECADQEYENLLDREDPGLYARLTFDPGLDPVAPLIGKGSRPRVAILREQGINGQVEMAAAFHRAGFDPVDLTMSDLLAGANLDPFHGLAACGGFSFGDVLGAGGGWAKSILYNHQLRGMFARFFQREDTFTLGVCNGCQMVSRLGELIPGSEGWPRFGRNLSEQFESRLVLAEIPANTRSILLSGMAGSRLPVICAHGEGRASFATDPGESVANLLADGGIALRYVDHAGNATERYPFNPNGSPGGLAGLTSADGRVTIMMPHPERLFRTMQHSWHPPEWGEDGPWLRLFRNARVWLG